MRRTRTKGYIGFDTNIFITPIHKIKDIIES